MRGIILPLVLAAAMGGTALAQEVTRPAGFELIIGPRVGANYVLTTPADFNARVSAFYGGGGYFPAMSVFGAVVEQRILLGESRSHFAFQEVLAVTGLEQGLSIPSLVLLMGFRASSGLELGLGPRLTPTGVGVAVAVGWTFAYRGVFVPVDLSFVLPSGDQPSVLALTTGFNFVIASSRRAAGK